jgi:hypothetical protein
MDIWYPYMSIDSQLHLNCLTKVKDIVESYVILFLQTRKQVGLFFNRGWVHDNAETDPRMGQEVAPFAHRCGSPPHDVTP